MRSSWTILILGVIAFSMIAAMMLLMLDRLKETPAGNRARLSNEIRESFRFDAVRVDRQKEDGRETIIVAYDTEEPLADPERLESQMRSVAVFVFQKCDEQDRKEVDRARIVRREIRRAGCDRQVVTSEYKMVNPELKKLIE
ncbi:MAG: hypothetical protein HYY17_03825 [Planctomycetes bacterium]|nr:hypothetical protein [Planctomycetota bacterium]